MINKQVLVKGLKFKKYKRAEELTKETTGWYFNPEDKNGVIIIKTAKLSLAADAAIKMIY